MRKLAAIAATVLPLCLAQAAWAQAPTANAFRISEARQANAALMRQFAWESRTEILSKGEVKDVRVDAMGYGPDGQLQRNNISDDKAPVRGLIFRQLAADRAAREIKDYLEGLRGILEQYTLPNPGAVQDFLDRSVATGPDSQGLFQLTGRNVVQPGDTFAMWINPQTRQPVRVQVSTTFNGDPVTLNASYRTLAPFGLNYVEFANVYAPAKQLEVQVHNYNYYRKF
jgi:hypothetical protein